MDVMQPRQVMANDVAAGNLIQQGRILALHGVPPGVSFPGGGRDPVGPFTWRLKNGIHHVTNIAIRGLSVPGLGKIRRRRIRRAGNSRLQRLEPVPSREVRSSVS
jgi:hypothetical protein